MICSDLVSEGVLILNHFKYVSFKLITAILVSCNIGKIFLLSWNCSLFLAYLMLILECLRRLTDGTETMIALRHPTKSRRNLKA